MCAKTLESKEKEYEELRRMAKRAGLADLFRLHDEYRRLLDLSDRYLQQLNPKFTFSTTDSST